MFGICIVTFGSADIIGNCLASLRASEDQDFRVVILDNASQDATCDRIRDFAADAGWSLTDRPLPHGASGATVGVADKLTLLRSSRNLGFAGGVNRGIEALLPMPEILWFWILNPDCESTPTTIGAFRKAIESTGDFALLGGRTLYHEAPNAIQSDGGRLDPWSGICSNVNQGRLPQETVSPDDHCLDFISGANMLASRAFIEQVGPMVEDYFLYYEEVDWAARRGDLPLAFCHDAVVYHHGGTAIGTGSVTKRASPFANYFNFRNRIRFMRRFHPAVLPVAWTLSMLRIVKLLAIGAFSEAVAAFAGLNGLPPPQAVRARIAPVDHFNAFEKRDRRR